LGIFKASFKRHFAQNSIYPKKIILFFFIIAFCLFFLSCLCSCHRQDPWSINYIRTGNQAFNSSKLCYRSHDKINGIDLEILSTTENLRIYLLVHSQPIPSYKDNPKKAYVEINAKNQKHVFTASRREGGQKILLPETMHGLIFSTLSEGAPLTIQLEGYISIIEPYQFTKLLDKILKPQPISLPFDSPFKNF
jgi:hypothetical protein